jgi:uncharacterized protein Yka (UPF0111/DUF47 family)
MVGKKQWEEKVYSVSKKKSCAKEIFESIKGCKHPLIASGATTIGSAGRAPDRIIARIKKLERREDNIFEPILKKLSTIASGATPIGSTGRAPDDDGNH